MFVIRVFETSTKNYLQTRPQYNARKCIFTRGGGRVEGFTQKNFPLFWKERIICSLRMRTQTGRPAEGAVRNRKFGFDNWLIVY